MCRSIIRFFLGALIVLLAFLAIFLWTVRLQLLDSRYYKNFLEKNDVYELVIVKGKEYAAQSSNTPEEGVVLAQPVIDVLLEKFITADLIQDVAERNLDNGFGWLNGRKEKLFLYFPKQYVLDNLNIEVIDSLETEINTIIKSLPTCTPAQLEEMQGEEISATSEITCLPDSFELEERDYSEIFKNIQDYTGTNPIEGFFGSQGPLKGLSEEVDVIEFLKNSPREEGAPDPEKSINQIKQNFTYFTWFLIGLSLFNLVLVFLYILLGGLKNWLKSSGILFIFISIPITFVGLMLTLPLEFGEKLFRTYVFEKLPPEISTYLAFVPPLIVKFISGVFFPLIIVGIILLVLGILGLIVNKLINKEKKVEIAATTEVKETKEVKQKETAAKKP